MTLYFLRFEAHYLLAKMENNTDSYTDKQKIITKKNFIFFKSLFFNDFILLYFKPSLFVSKILKKY